MLALARLANRMCLFRSAALTKSLAASPEVLVGVPVFDSAYILTTDAPSAARAIFGDPKVLQRLSISGMQAVDIIRLLPADAGLRKSSEILVEVEGIVTDQSDLKTLRCLAIAIAERAFCATARE